MESPEAEGFGIGQTLSAARDSFLLL